MLWECLTTLVGEQSFSSVTSVMWTGTSKTIFLSNMLELSTMGLLIQYSSIPSTSSPISSSITSSDYSESLLSSIVPNRGMLIELNFYKFSGLNMSEDSSRSSCSVFLSSGAVRFSCPWLTTLLVQLIYVLAYLWFWVSDVSSSSIISSSPSISLAPTSL